MSSSLVVMASCLNILISLVILKILKVAVGKLKSNISVLNLSHDNSETNQTNQRVFYKTAVIMSKGRVVQDISLF